MNLSFQSEHQNSGYEDHFRTPTLHKIGIKPFWYRRKLMRMLVSRLRNKAAFLPGPGSLGTLERYKSREMPPHLCAASALMQHLLLI